MDIAVDIAPPVYFAHLQPESEIKEPNVWDDEQIWNDMDVWEDYQ